MQIADPVSPEICAQALQRAPSLWTICRKHFRMPLHCEVKRMFRIVETFNNAVVAASAVQYHAGSEILHALMVAAVDANLLTAHDSAASVPGTKSTNES